MTGRFGVATSLAVRLQLLDDPVVGQRAEEGSGREVQGGGLEDPAQVIRGELTEVHAPIRVISVA
jgi:hypothetical protein